MAQRNRPAKVPPHVVEARQREANIVTARIIPFVLVGVVGYVTWTNVVLLAINYLIHPPSDTRPQRGAGIAIIVLHFLFLILMSVTYFRTIQLGIVDPAYVPRSAEGGKDSSQPAKEKNQGGEEDPILHGYLDRPGVLSGRCRTPPGLKRFYSKEVFECDADGLPRWCTVCHNWKPDRSHHCSELDRCIYKMDHFCPWAGGIISDSNFKFFVQFCLYTASFCTLVLISTAYFLSQLHGHNLYKINWIVTVALAGLFLSFAGGIGLNALAFVFRNLTTVDSVTLKKRTYHVAIRMPPLGPDSPPPPFATITYPLPDPTGPASSSTNVRTFAILQIPLGKNPYDLGEPFQNLRSVMGEHWYDWFLPIRLSPGTLRRRAVEESEDGCGERSLYPFGVIVDQLKKEHLQPTEAHSTT